MSDHALPLRLFGQHPRQCVRDRLAFKHPPAGEHLIKHHAERPDIRPLVHRLPARLQELQSLADLDRPLNFTCPISGKPYEYSPTGMSTQGDSRLLILYDAVPTTSGTRVAISYR